MSRIGDIGQQSTLFPEEDPHARPQHYSPGIERFLVSVIYHEARCRKIPMTRLVDDIIKKALANSTGWQLALQLINSPGRESFTCTDQELKAKSR
jgi:hypothetical protein